VKGSKDSKCNASRAGFSSGNHTQFCPQNGGAIMVKAKSKQEKREETTEEFVKRINQHKEWDNRNGSKRRTGRHHR